MEAGGRCLKDIAPGLLFSAEDGCARRLDALGVDLSLVVASADFQAMYAANRLIAFLSRLRHPGSLAIVI